MSFPPIADIQRDDQYATMNDNEFTGTVFTPSTPDFPLLAIIFKNGEVVSWREVASLEEGEESIAEAVKTLPTLG